MDKPKEHHLKHLKEFGPKELELNNGNKSSTW